MADHFLEYSDITMEDLGILNTGRIKLSDQSVQFKNAKTGKLQTIATADITELQSIRLGNRPGLKFILGNGHVRRFGGFAESEYDRIRNYAKNNWNIDIVQKELCIKGWNYGECIVAGQSIEFEVDEKPCFSIPLSNVSNCSTGAKNEAILEFHQNDDCPVSLAEMRFHIPQPDADEDVDPVEEFRKAVMQYAGIESETDQPVAILSQILCTTPRGRYDIKVYQNHLSLHGKTYDYKIPIKTVMRLFLLPHKDGRRMYFVMSLNPPIRQGQTRYHFLVFEFAKEDNIDLELGLTEEQLQEQYRGRIERELSGQVYVIVSKIFRVLIDQKITVPGSFVGHSGTPAIGCAYKQAAGFLYPLEKGFVFVHKPPMYIRFEEIASVNFARSDVSTRSFDFEIELKGGSQHVFNSVEKEEYTRLFDYVNNKRLRIRNAKRLDKPVYNEDTFAGSDDEIDPYKETVRQEAKAKAGSNDDDDRDSSDSEDSDYDLEKDTKREKEKKRAASSGSGSDSGSEPDEEYDSDAGSASAGDDGSGSDEGGKESAKAKLQKKVKKTASAAATSTKKKTKKAVKDPAAPKKPSTAYMIWFNESRESIKKAGDSVTDTAKRAGQQWKAMTDKTKWEKKAEADRERYKVQLKEYQANGGDIAASSSASAAKKTKTSSSSATATTTSPSKSAKSKEFVETDNSSDDDAPLKKSTDMDDDESGSDNESD